MDEEYLYQYFTKTLDDNNIKFDVIELKNEISILLSSLIEFKIIAYVHINFLTKDDNIKYFKFLDYDSKQLNKNNTTEEYFSSIIIIELSIILEYVRKNKINEILK
jgi:hypothetical protein